MNKYSFGNGQYIVYARNEQEARQIISKELVRFDNIKELMANLLTENGQALENFMSNTSEERLNIHFNSEYSLIYDEDSTSRGMVRQRNVQDGVLSYDLAYRHPDIEGHDANFRLAHEMGHLMLNPSNTKKQTFDEQSNSRQVAGLIRRDERDNQFYGKEIQENAINLIAQLAIRGDIKADDIITGKVDLSEFNSYKKCDSLVKLLAMSMRNDFDKEISFEQLAQDKIDSIIIHEDGTQEPANLFFYGILNDSSILENEFDKYLGRGAWRELNAAFSELYKSDISKERFDLIFQNAEGLIEEFANSRFQDKYRETFIRNGGVNVPNVENKLQMIKQITVEEEERNLKEEQEMEFPEGYYINEYGEIIRPAKIEKEQLEQEPIKTNKTIEENITANNYEEELQHPQQIQNKLSVKQKVAHFLQKKNLFMNLSFVENFVRQQLDVLQPPTQENRELDLQTQETSELNSPTQETRELSPSAASVAIENFINELANSRERINIQPSRRMSDPQRIEQMRRRMDQNGDERDR